MKNKKGYFGKYGGRFVPEMLIPALEELERAYDSAKKDSQFKKIENEEKIALDPFEIKAFHTPGHTKGSLCFYVENHLISGDTLFVDKCGRCDFKGGDVNEMYASLQKIINYFDSKTILLPGHDYGHSATDTLENQKNVNPYLKIKTLEEFARLRGGKIRKT
jgi:glyoxylase-like metal-dependent hydrolase (beta-lactamase superfamily II)